MDQKNNTPVLSPILIQKARFLLRLHVRHRLLTSQVGIVQLVLAPCLSSWPQRFAAALRLLFLLFAEIVSFILALILVSYDTYVAFCYRTRRKHHRFQNGWRF